MHHLFLNLDVQPLGRTPFTPIVDHALNVKARDLGLPVLLSSNIHVLPIEAAFVGADNVAVLITEEPYNQDDILLIIDIGTNGELILGNRQRLLSASCATGPAFEGGNIKFGMRAAPDAIAKVRINPETLDVRFQLIGQSMQHRRLSDAVIAHDNEVRVMDACSEFVQEFRAPEELAFLHNRPSGAIGVILGLQGVSALSIKL